LPNFGEDTVLLRTAKVRSGTLDSVKPGLHQPEKGSHGVIFWDPAVLKLGLEEDLGVRQQRVLAPAEGAAVPGADASQRAAREWREGRAHAHAEGVRSHLATEPVTHAAERASEHDAALVTFETLAKEPERPTGRRFGTYVHAVLSSLRATTETDETSKLARYWGRILGAPAAEQSAAAAIAASVLKSALWQRVKASREVLQETHMSLRSETAHLEGAIDLVFIDETEPKKPKYIVVDYKTDAPSTEEARAQYTRQVRIYAAAISKARGIPCECIVLML
jgi:ATP-dependent helicase/nuclease subunit A